MVKRCAGFTVVEVAMVMTLTLTLLTLMGMYMVRGQRYAAETETYSSVQSSANTLLRRITNELYRSSSKQVVVEPGGLIFLSFGPTAAEEPGRDLELDPETGKIIWKKWVGFYFDENSETVLRGELALEEKILDLDTPVEPAMDLPTFRVLPTVRRHPEPGRVKSFSATLIGNRVRLRLRTHGVAPVVTHTEEQKQVEVSVETEVSLLN